MDPDFWDKVKQITAGVRRAIVPDQLDKLEKGASKFGESIGTGLEKQHAQAGYTDALLKKYSPPGSKFGFTGMQDPRTQRAQQERMSNAVTLALSMGAGLTTAEEGAAAKPYSLHGNIEHTSTSLERPAGAVAYGPKITTLKPGEALPPVPTVSPKLQTAAHAKFGDFLDAATGIRKGAPRDASGAISKEHQDAYWASMNAALHLMNPKNAALTQHLVDFPITKARALEAQAPKALTAGTPDPVDLVKQLKENGGFTVNPRTGNPITSGYSVGGGNAAADPASLMKIPMDKLTPKHLQFYLDQHASKFPEGTHMGGWVDNGTAYIEPSQPFGDLKEATKVGNARGEKAIYDHATGKDIVLQKGRAETGSMSQAEIDHMNTPGGQDALAARLLATPEQRDAFGKRWRAGIDKRSAAEDAEVKKPAKAAMDSVVSHAPWIFKHGTGAPLDVSKLGANLPEGAVADSGVSGSRLDRWRKENGH